MLGMFRRDQYSSGPLYQILQIWFCLEGKRSLNVRFVRGCQNYSPKPHWVASDKISLKLTDSIKLKLLFLVDMFRGVFRTMPYIYVKAFMQK